MYQIATTSIPFGAVTIAIRTADFKSCFPTECSLAATPVSLAHKHNQSIGCAGTHLASIVAPRRKDRQLSAKSRRFICPARLHSGRRAAAIISLIQSARLDGLDSCAYLKVQFAFVSFRVWSRQTCIYPRHMSPAKALSGSAASAFFA